MASKPKTGEDGNGVSSPDFDCAGCSREDYHEIKTEFE